MADKLPESGTPKTKCEMPKMMHKMAIDSMK